VGRARWDAVMVLLTAAQAAVLLAVPSGPLIALGLWWNANTVAHNFIHRPFFATRRANRMFAAGLSVLLGFPLALWRDRHLAHHAGIRPRLRSSIDLTIQAALVLLLWAAIAGRSPGFFLAVYLPGYLVGLLLCALHGYYEHARGTTSHYGRLYNALFFNDGYHIEHHAHPGVHWTMLPNCRSRASCQASSVSAWPAPIRWLDLAGLESLERLVLRSEALQRFVLSLHRRAFRRLLEPLSPVDHVAIVGGGLFPRTALVLRELLPASRITIIDASADNLDCARSVIARRARAVSTAEARRSSSGDVMDLHSVPSISGRVPDVECIHARYPHCDLGRFDLVVFPLSFDGAREDLYERPPAPTLIVHDWIWSRHGTSRVVSVLLLKRMNLVRR
jgi:hypothetical protein